MGIKICPQCKSTKIITEAGGMIGIWRCVQCGFTSSIFPEIEIDKEELKKNKKSKQNE